MIVSYSKKFIFFKPKKVAGSSVQYYLGSLCDPLRDYFGIPGQLPIELKRYKARYGSLKIRNLNNLNHSFPYDIKKDLNISDENFNLMTKVTIVRNLYDEIVSQFYYQNRLKLEDFNLTKKIFNKFIINNINEDRNIKYYIDDNDNFICNIYIRFENLQEDFNEFCELLNIKKGELPKLKSGTRKFKNKTYRDFYNDDSIEKVKKIYKKRIELFNYEF